MLSDDACAVAAGGGVADAAGLREFLRVAVTAPFLSLWCSPEASCLRASPRDGAHPDNQGSWREFLAAAGVHPAEADGQFGGAGPPLRAGSLGVRRPCGGAEAVWTAQAPWQEVLGESANGGRPGSFALLDETGAAF